jgi:hypothetical protein
MDDAVIVFSLDTYYYTLPDDPEAVTRFIPHLDVYRSAADAAANREGMEIVETLAGYDGLWFFAADGSPLEAHFSQRPYFDKDKPTYFPGVYSLHSGTGENLLDAIWKVIEKNEKLAPGVRIEVAIAGTNEAAKHFGWSDTIAMKEGVGRALEILPADMRARVVFTQCVVVDGKLCYRTDDAIGS